MLYLIQLPQYDQAAKYGFSILKIGYTKDIQRRFGEYRYGCLNAEILGVREGSQEDEQALHTYLRMYKLNEFNEYYNYNEKVIRVFNELPLGFSDKSNKFSRQLVDILKLKLYIKTNYDLNEDLDLEKLVYPLKNRLRFEDSDSIIDYYCETELSLIRKENHITLSDIKFDKNILKFVLDIQKTSNFIKQFRLYCKFRTDNPEIDLSLFSLETLNKYKYYYETLGPEKCKSLSYQESKIVRNINSLTTLNSEQFKKELMNTFLVGKVYTKKGVKESLLDIYSRNGIIKVPKSTDLEEYFTIKDTKLYDENSKQVAAIRILNIK